MSNSKCSFTQHLKELTKINGNVNQAVRHSGGLENTGQSPAALLARNKLLFATAAVLLPLILWCIAPVLVHSKGLISERTTGLAFASDMLYSSLDSFSNLAVPVSPQST
jgi:hypothetical protein